jgi:hypothetical protein
VCVQTELAESMTPAEHIRAVFYRMVSTVYHSVNAAYILSETKTKNLSKLESKRAADLQGWGVLKIINMLLPVNWIVLHI